MFFFFFFEGGGWGHMIFRRIEEDVHCQHGVNGGP